MQRIRTSKHIIIACVIARGSMAIGSVNGYFEHTYFCDIDGSSISVSIQEGDRLCFEYLASMATTIADLDAGIIRAQSYVNVGTEDDRAYWEGVLGDLNRQKQDWLSLRERLVVAIDDYEWDLFLRIKGLVAFYLKPEREVIFDKITQANSLGLRLKVIGDVERYEFVLEKLDGLQHKLALLDRIKFSQNFSELIPALKEYLQLPRINRADLT